MRQIENDFAQGHPLNFVHGQCVLRNQRELIYLVAHLIEICKAVSMDRYDLLVFLCQRRADVIFDFDEDALNLSFHLVFEDEAYDFTVRRVVKTNLRVQIFGDENLSAYRQVQVFVKFSQSIILLFDCPVIAGCGCKLEKRSVQI